MVTVRRRCGVAALVSGVALCAVAAPSEPAAVSGPIRPLAQTFVVLAESPTPQTVYCYTPGLTRLDCGRLVATMEFGGPGWKREESNARVFTSDDRGRTWAHRASFAMTHGRPFQAGSSVYVLGHRGNLRIIRSDDRGETWSDAVDLTEKQSWHQSACNVIHANDSVYLVMERKVTSDIRGWGVGELAPVLMRGAIDADLTRVENWTFASELSFRQTIPGVETDPAIDFFGVPFYPAAYPSGSLPAPKRNSAPLGWLEANVVRLAPPDQTRHDPDR